MCDIYLGSMQMYTLFCMHHVHACRAKFSISPAPIVQPSKRAKLFKITIIG